MKRAFTAWDPLIEIQVLPFSHGLELTIAQLKRHADFRTIFPGQTIKLLLFANVKRLPFSKKDP